MIFDAKMDNFCQKTRLVAGGNMFDVLATVTYGSVVLRETICIALTMAALNMLKVMAKDIMNAYITAPNEEKIWTLLGPKFGKDTGSKTTAVRALYRLKSARSAVRSSLADCMIQLRYNPKRWIQIYR